MILNPPHIQRLLRAWQRLRRQVPAALHAEYLGALFRLIIHPLPSYDEFLSLYHLYLQSIPLHTAQEAWGIHYANGSLPSPQS